MGQKGQYRNGEAADDPASNPRDANTMPDAQIIFVDTPGIHRQRGQGDESAYESNGREQVRWRTPTSFCSSPRQTRWTDEDDDVLKRIKKQRAARHSRLINKVDKVIRKTKSSDTLSEMSERH